MRKTIALFVTVLLVGLGAEAWAQKELKIGLYAPSAAFPSSQARLAYVQGLAKAIENRTGIPTKGQAFVRYQDLVRADVDFAIIEGQCVAARDPGDVLAQASIGGRTSLTWALFATSGGGFPDLRGKRLAYAATGCRDDDFLENAMMESEVKLKYFGRTVQKPDVAGAITAVKDYKQAEAVFAPADQGRGMRRLFETTQVPTPAFVRLNSKIPAGVVDKVKQAVLSYGASGGIDGWKAGSKSPYAQLASKMRTQVKRPVFASPSVERLDDLDILVVPKSDFEEATVAQHFWELQ